MLSGGAFCRHVPPQCPTLMNVHHGVAAAQRSNYLSKRAFNQRPIPRNALTPQSLDMSGPYHMQPH